jgi:4-amino-4-deoxy-L-arabinose transferase-like glycosyltransferase
MLNSRWSQIVIVVLATAVVMLTNLGGPRLWDRDEPRNAGCAREMLERHDWIKPTFNAELRGHKPAFLYWCMMGTYSVLGVNEFSARLPSAVFAIGTVLCTWFLGQRLFGGQTGLWSGLALASSMMFGVAGRAATPDSVLVFWSTLALTIYIAATFKARQQADEPLQLTFPGEYFPQHLPSVIAIYAAMGMAVLAKGPVGLVLPTAVIGMFLLIVRLPKMSEPTTLTAGLLRLLRPFEPRHFLATCAAMQPITAILTVAAVALPWYLAVQWATNGEFLEQFLWVHNVGRAIQPMEGHRGGLLWFSVAQTKLPSYISPCYPGLALLFGSFLDRWIRNAVAIHRWWMPLSLGVLVLDGLAFVLVMPTLAERFLPGEGWLGLIGLALVVGGVLALGWLLLSNRQAAGLTFAVTTISFATLVFAVGAQRANNQHSHSHIVDAARRHNADLPLYAFQILEPSWVFYAGHPVPHITADKARTAGKTSATILAEHFARQPKSLVIMTSTEFASLAAEIPNCEVVAEAPRLLEHEQWVVVEQKNDVRVAGKRSPAEH